MRFNLEVAYSVIREQIAARVSLMISRELKIIIVLVLVACLGGFISDIYVPSFFTMAKDLHANMTDIQQSMSIFMLALALFQFVYGPLSEVFGRRPTLLSGVFLMMIGSLICIFTENFSQLMMGRFIQGIGAGACTSLWRSIFRDIFNSEKMAKYGGYLGIAMVYVVAASPFLGGYLEVYSSWRASFVASTLYGLIVFLMICLMLPETNSNRKRENLSIKFFVSAYKQLLKSTVFMGYSFCVFFTYGAFFSWFVVGPPLVRPLF